MEASGFLNLEYFFLLIYNALHGVEYQSVPGGIGGWISGLQTLGIFLSLIFFALLVYFFMRYEQLHHAHDHEQEAHAHEVHENHVAAKNERWDHVTELMTEPNASSWRAAILEADILLSELLTALGLQGDSIGEQLKQVNRTQFTTLDLAWEAHKVRNEVAHGGSTFDLTQREAERTITMFRQVFDEFGII